MTDEPAIRARGLTKRFGDFTAVDDLDLTVPRGRIYGFLGPNGSGKSTTIRMLCGLLTPSAGSATVFGLEVPGDAATLKPRIGYMTQKFSLFTDLTVRENLEFIGEIYSVPAAERRRRVEALLKEYRLEALHDQLTGTMSGGQKQRLALACAVLHRPDLLLLDEPTSAVDPQSRRDFWAALFELADAGTTLLVSTHYMDEAERCHRLAILDRGKKAADGTPDELKQATGMQVIEVETADPSAAEKLLEARADTRSVTQLGLRLRVLMAESIERAADLIASALEGAGLVARARRVEPSLEDVFVAATQRPAPS